ncbi:hypothetical protein AB5J49_42970 [Streptomyces sp. R28]|uniref:Uncharacterized protein n=1 Tax=Streptomyces sp. R28 TaxID=3238628 RepID=A0AB39Q8G8_9ACTN
MPFLVTTTPKAGMVRSPTPRRTEAHQAAEADHRHSADFEQKVVQ